MGIHMPMHIRCGMVIERNAELSLPTFGGTFQCSFNLFASVAFQEGGRALHFAQLCNSPFKLPLPLPFRAIPSSGSNMKVSLPHCSCPMKWPWDRAGGVAYMMSWGSMQNPLLIPPHTMLLLCMPSLCWSLPAHQPLIFFPDRKEINRRKIWG